MQNLSNAPRCYTRKNTNPYHFKLQQFHEFVYLDEQAESFKGQWKSAIFKNNLPLVVEIGVGYGDFMMNYCQQNPEVNYVGMDIRFKRSFGVAKKLEQQKLQNLRFLRAQGQRIPWLFDKHEIDQLFCFFPDPWPRAKQVKKRVFQRTLIGDLSKIIKPTGCLLFKTDHLDMFEWTLQEISHCENVQVLWHTHNLYQDYELVQNTKIKELLLPMVTFQTKFEKIFLQQNTSIKALILCPLA